MKAHPLLSLATAGVLIAALALAGCSTVSYYGQAVQGQLSMMSAARPVDEVLDDPQTSAALKQKLQRAQQIREFAWRELGLPNNDSYTRYADLGRPAVVWNVFATPELSMELKRWCYPVVGCAGYRGYFDKARAEQTGDALRTQGYDVNISAIPAYSTLGWFADPLLNTFIHWPDGELARLIFHELAHQVVYVDHDTVFNESFATAVERVGVQRWLALHGDEALRSSYAAYERRRTDFVALLLAYRQQLDDAYAASSSDADKRARKQALFAQLQADYQQLKQERWSGFSGYDRFFAQPLNNAHLAAVGAYNELVPAFDALLQAQGGDLPKFYAEVKRIGSLPKAQRAEKLAALARTQNASRGL